MGESYRSTIEVASRSPTETIGGVRAACLNALAEDVKSGGDTARGICTPWEYEQVSKLNLEGVKDIKETEGSLGGDIEQVQNTLSGDHAEHTFPLPLTLESYMQFWDSLSGGNEMLTVALAVGTPAMIVATLLAFFQGRKV